MSINPRSVHQIIQEVNCSIDVSQALDQRVIDIAKKALLEVDRIPFKTCFDEREFSALAFRISLLVQTKSLVDGDAKAALLSAFLAKAKLISNEALQIEAILSKYPKIREEIISDVSSFENEGMSIEERVSVLNRIGEEKMEALIEFVKKRVSQDPEGVSENIKNYGITDQNALIEIAKIAAAQSGRGLSQNIKNYGITDQNALIEIAKIAAAQSCRGVSVFIKNYGITDQNALIEIAKIVAAQDGYGVSEFIQRYGIMDERALIEIAKIAAARTGECVSYFIGNYGITDRNALIEIAKIAAAQSSAGTSAYIKRYGIKDQSALIEIAKIAAARDGLGVSIYIKEYGIRDQNALIEIAKIAAAHPRHGLSGQVKNYGITDQSVLIEIALIGAAQKGGELSENIRTYGITDQNARLKIAKIAVYRDPRTVLRFLDDFELNEETNQYRDLVLYGLLCGFAFGGKEFIWFAEYSSKYSRFLIQRNHPSIAENVSPFTKRNFVSLASFLQIYAKDLLPEDLWNESDRNSVLGKIASYRNPLAGGSLALHLFEQGSIREFKDSYVSFALESTKKGASKNELLVHKILPSIVLAKWLAQAKEEGSITFLEEKIVSDLSSFITKSRKEFRNNLSPLLQTLLLTSLDLDKAEGLSSIRKLQLLSRICNQKDCIKGLGLIRSLLARKQTLSLNAISLENPIQSLKFAFEEALLKDQYVNLSCIENLADKYLGAFENTRTPFALEIYTTKLRALGDEKVKESLSRFVKSVLEGTFEEERYNIDKSPHLKQVQAYDEKNGTHILAGWRRLAFETSVAPVSKASQQEIFSFENFFRQKLEDGHGRREGREVLKHLSDFFTVKPDRRDGILEDLTQRIETEKVNILSETDPEEKARLSKLLKLDQVQKSCLELITDSSISRKMQISKLESILSVGLDIELANDLKGLVNSFREPQKSSCLEKVQIYSGWEDLFLAGSEVEGSCQRIDGDPNLNKCLLAYCLDGKNSMVAVKGSDGKIIARSMLRLLWNNTDSKPVLFLDRLYPSPCSKERESSIQMASIECARTLGIDLFTAGNGLSSSEKTIESLGSSCPYEYADAAGGVMPNGVFTIRNLQKIEVYI